MRTILVNYTAGPLPEDGEPLHLILMYFRTAKRKIGIMILVNYCLILQSLVI